jgi:Zn-finger nucleic acid-binding protein
MQCPKCQSSAVDFNTSEGVLVNFCEGCKGLWFDAGELALYCETERDVPHIAALLGKARATAFACPRCLHTRLVELPYMGGEAVLIDWCPACRGAWLDAGELKKVEHLATRFESHTARLKRAVSELAQAGYRVVGVRATGGSER